MKTKTAAYLTFVFGLAIVAWMAATFVGTNSLALLITLIIGATYCFGFRELRNYQKITESFSQALKKSVSNQEQLKQWLNQLDISLRTPVALRIEGERSPMPTPMLTSYLVGLLIMLGLLGTFAGMVNTLQGAVTALQGSAELEAIRAGLAAPIKGLGLAFGTSVAGVAASAMLGFIATLSKRDRLLTSQVLDQAIASELYIFSRNHQHQQTLAALQKQTDALPKVANHLEQLSEKLSSNQSGFHTATAALYQDLAQSVAATLTHTLSESSRLAGSSLKPVFEEVMNGLQQENRTQQQQWLQHAEQQLGALTESFKATNNHLALSWQNGLDQQKQAFERSHKILLDTLQQHEQTQRQKVTELLTANETLVSARIASEEQWLQQSKQQVQELISSISQQLSLLRNEEAQRGDTAQQRLIELQQALAIQLDALTASLQQPLNQLMATAAEAPQAATKVIAQLQQDISANRERDNALLKERQQLITQIDQLTNSLHEHSALQQNTILSLVTETQTMLSKADQQFQQQITNETEKLTEVVDLFAASTNDMACLGESFEVAISHFNDGNERLMTHLNNIEQALQNATQRSDEQLGYYVAQAREIIDYSMISQQEVIDKIRQINQPSGTA